MKRIILSITILFLVFNKIDLIAQNYCWIYFKQKHTTFDPHTYFDNKAIERRIRQGLAICDSSDFPVNEEYVKRIEKNVDSVYFVSRWMNAMAVYATEAQVNRIKTFDFVNNIEVFYNQNNVKYCQFNNSENALYLSDNELLKVQVNHLGIKYFQQKGITGKGIRIAVFDGGFPAVDTHEAFEHIRNENRIIKTYDFTRKKEFVYAYSTHGTMVLSCIAGIYKGKNIGLAPDAEFLLARTEVNSEPFKEEVFWLAAAEWADKNGADIINSSLGYTHHRYFNYQMDGKTTFVTRAANKAASKGMLVVNAAGNEGDTKWNFIGAPADADSVLSVGGIDPETGYQISFSSFGPTADKRLKPNVSAIGHTVAASKKGVVQVDGTSFASPLVAGFAACAWLTDTTLTNMQLFRKIEESATLYPYFDYAHGYGIPQASFFTGDLKKNVDTTFIFKRDDENLYIIIKDNIIISKKNSEEKPFDDYLYYNIQDEKGYIKKFYVIEVEQKDAVTIEIDELEPGQKVVAFYKGYSTQYIVE